MILTDEQQRQIAAKVQAAREQAPPQTGAERRAFLREVRRKAEQEIAASRPPAPATGLRVSRHAYGEGTAAGTYVVEIHPDNARLGARVPGSSGRGEGRVEEGPGLSAVEAENQQQEARRRSALY